MNGKINCFIFQDNLSILDKIESSYFDDFIVAFCCNFKINSFKARGSSFLSLNPAVFNINKITSISFSLNFSINLFKISYTSCDPNTYKKIT